MKFRGSTTQTLLLIGMVLLTLLSGGSILNLSLNDLGYSSAFQGPKVKFMGVRMGVNKTTTGDTVLRFDPDGATSGKPDLIGEMTTIFVPKQSLSDLRDWIPVEWLSGTEFIKNPQETYSWNISGKVCRMEQWVLKWYLSISAEGQSSEITTLHPLQPWILGSTQNNIYTQTEVWFEFDLTPTWYIEGGGTAYFALAKITLSNKKSEVKDNAGNIHTSDTSMSFSPGSGQLYMYNEKWGATQTSQVDAHTFQGKVLNPAYFRNKLYAHFDLNNFGIRSWIDFPSVRSKGDVVTVGFDVTVFVIGEWDVKDIADVDLDDFGRTTKITSTGPSLMDVLNDPRFQGIFTLFVLGGICLFLLIFAPWVLFAIVGLFRSGRRR